MITLDKLTHLYHEDGRPIKLSVTRVLENAGIIAPYPPDARQNVLRAGDLGEAVHEWCQYLDTMGLDGEEEALEGSDVLPYVLAYQKFRENYNPEWFYVEEPMVREDVGGVPDRIGCLCNGDSTYAILDIKTSRKISAWWGMQLTGYRWLSMKYDARIYALQLSRDASYRLFEYEPHPVVWEAALEIARWKLENQW